MKMNQYTIHWDNKNVLKISIGQNKLYKKLYVVSFASSNSSQFYFQFVIPIWAKAQGWSL